MELIYDDDYNYRPALSNLSAANNYWKKTSRPTHTTLKFLPLHNEELMYLELSAVFS
jgi:hypothetical protein